MTIKEASEKTGISIDNLRYYERIGLIPEVPRSKSGVFAYHLSEYGVPIIEEAPVVMECAVTDIYNTAGFESFICTIDHVYAEETVVDEKNKIDYHKLKPVLFEMPTYEYLRTGDVIGKCMTICRKDSI